MDKTRICMRCLAPVRLADAEFRESPAPRDGEPDRTYTARLHPECAALSDGLVEMGRRLGSVAAESQAEL